jgi:hypothetical protein
LWTLDLKLKVYGNLTYKIRIVLLRERKETKLTSIIESMKTILGNVVK